MLRKGPKLLYYGFINQVFSKYPKNIELTTITTFYPCIILQYLEVVN